MVEGRIPDACLQWYGGAGVTMAGSFYYAWYPGEGRLHFMVLRKWRGLSCPATETAH